jgi:hypothetical protein
VAPSCASLAQISHPGKQAAPQRLTVGPAAVRRSTAPSISGYTPQLMPPDDNAIAACEDVLDRLVPRLNGILEYLRGQGRHPDTSLLAPPELFIATGLYFTGDELNRLLHAFNADALDASEGATNVQDLAALPPCISSKELLAAVRARQSRRRDAMAASGGSGRRRTRSPPKRASPQQLPHVAATAAWPEPSAPQQLEHAKAALEAAENGGASDEAIRSARCVVVELSNQRAVQMLAKGELSACFKLLDNVRCRRRHLLMCRPGYGWIRCCRTATAPTHPTRLLLPHLTTVLRAGWFARAS